MPPKLMIDDYVFDALKGCDVSKEILMKSLVGFHTGCDTISAFAGKGKVKPLKLMLNNTILYVQSFAQLGENTDISQTTLQTIKSFVCHMYGWKGFDSVDEIRYRMYCQSGGKIACQQLPPCTDVLELHVMRANYQACIWRERAWCNTKMTLIR